MYQYRCACCDQIVSATEKSCPNCGSHTIRSPFGFWFFCIVACLLVAIAIMVGKLYFSPEQMTPSPQGVMQQVLQTGKSLLSH
ncbi:hypothetical protein FXN70_01330 [Acinetobacter sp. MD2]|nr:hypothetical protein [Acinetobacter sp. MD2]